MPAFDKNYMFRTTGNLTQTETSSALELKHSGGFLAARVVIPTNTGTTNALLAVVEASDTAVEATFVVISRYPSGAVSWAASVGQKWYIPFVTGKKYVRMKLTVSGSTGTPNFGAVQAGVVVGVQEDWSRGVNWN